MIDELLKRLGDHAELLARLYGGGMRVTELREKNCAELRRNCAARLLRRHHLLRRNLDLRHHLFELVFGERLAALELLHGGAAVSYTHLTLPTTPYV